MAFTYGWCDYCHIGNCLIAGRHKGKNICLTCKDRIVK